MRFISAGLVVLVCSVGYGGIKTGGDINPINPTFSGTGTFGSIVTTGGGTIGTWLRIGSTLDVAGTSTFVSSATFQGVVGMESNAIVDNNVNIGQDLQGKTATFSSTMGVVGAFTAHANASITNNLSVGQNTSTKYAAVSGSATAVHVRVSSLTVTVSASLNNNGWLGWGGSGYYEDNGVRIDGNSSTNIMRILTNGNPRMTIDGIANINVLPNGSVPMFNFTATSATAHNDFGARNNLSVGKTVRATDAVFTSTIGAVAIEIFGNTALPTSGYNAGAIFFDTDNVAFYGSTETVVGAQSWIQLNSPLVP